MSVSNHERRWAAAIPLLLALIFLGFHLPYRPQSLEDLDSINFALGVRHYDVAEHQPHPPGYPVYILVAKALRAVTGSELAALVLLSVVSGALGVFAIAALVRRISGRGADSWGLAATLIAVTSPLYWFTAVRPLSDMPGLAAAVGVQALTLGATTPLTLAVAGFCAAVAAGLRSQVVWLTLPLLMLQTGMVLMERRHERDSGVSTARPELVEGRARGSTSSPRAASAAILPVVAYALGILIWAVPLVLLTGGPRRYWSALTFQGSADIGNIQMLATRHGIRDIADAFYYAFIAPWAVISLAVVVLVLAALGFIAVAIRSPRAVTLLIVAFGPYFAFDLLFQETFTGRYALPLVIPIAYLAAAGARALPWRSGIVPVVAVAMYAAHIGGTSVAAFSREKAPAFRLLDDMREAVPADRRPILAMDRKQSFDFRRPIVWAAGALRNVGRVAPAPPQHEWLEPVKLWSRGDLAPVWFVVDPKRSMIDLVQHPPPKRYRWSLPYPILVSGARPDEMDWYRVEAPEWFVGEGWALTPEAAGIADADRHGLQHEAIRGWIANRTAGGVLAVGGRNFEANVQPEMTIAVDGQTIRQRAVPPGAFLDLIRLAPLAGDGPAGYRTLTIALSPPARAAIEQFDASSTRPVFGYGAGWQEQEFNPRTGLRWRWLSERGELRFGSATPRLMLHVEGESPRKYFSRGSRLVVRSGDRVVFDDVLAADFSLDIPVPGGTERMTLETDQVFQPADRSRRSADRRHLGLRIFRCEVRPVS